MIQRACFPPALVLLGASLLQAPVEARDPKGLASRAATQSPPLHLAEVLAAVDASHPSLEAARKTLDIYAGEQLAAEGAWDPVLSLEGSATPAGTYDYQRLQAQVRQLTPLWGIGLHAGYRLGTGTFPVYKGDYETLGDGELHVGIDMPLWKDGPIDRRRADIQRAAFLLDAAQCGVASARLQLHRSAAAAYWSWVAAGQQEKIQRALLEVAQERDAGLRTQAALGDIPQILVADNERLVLERQSKWIAAQRKLEKSALDLSLFLRDVQQNTLRVDADRVPQEIPEHVPLPLQEEPRVIEEAIARRPELCELQQHRAAAATVVRLKDNQLSPSVNLKAYVARDLGDGKAELEPIEVGLGVKFEMPLALRTARGAYRAATANVAKVDADLRRMRDLIAVEVRQALVDLRAAQRQVEIARRQTAVAQILADAERDKFAEGASELVIVNLRELSATESQRLEVQARAALQIAWTGYLASTGQGLVRAD